MMANEDAEALCTRENILVEFGDAALCRVAGRVDYSERVVVWN